MRTGHFIFWMAIGMLLLPAGCKGFKKSSSQPAPQTAVRPSATDATIIATIGDSITWGAMAYGARAPSGGYPAILQAILQTAGYHVVVRNQGIAGEKSFETDQRFLHAAAGAEIVLLQIGTNDLIRPETCPEPHNCRTAEHIAAILDQALAAQIVPFVSTVTPAQPGCNRSWANRPIQALNDQIRAAAQPRHVKIVDNYQAIIDNGGGALFADCLHFTDAGYRVLAQQWQYALVESALLKKIR